MGALAFGAACGGCDGGSQGDIIESMQESSLIADSSMQDSSGADESLEQEQSLAAGESSSSEGKSGSLEEAESSQARNCVFGAWYEVSPATCATAGVERRDCESCGDYQTREISPTNNHEYTERKYDDMQHWQECICGEVQDGSLQAHYGGKATATEKAVCELCNQAYGELDLPRNENGIILPGPESYERLEDGTINFGAYPQRLVTNGVVKARLNALAGTLPTSGNSRQWTSYAYYYGQGDKNSALNATDYMWYQDIVYEGESYRGVYFDKYRPDLTNYKSGANNSHQDNNGYYVGEVYWFAYEPLNWQVLEESDGVAFLLCNLIIDGQEFYDNYQERTVDNWKVYPSNYAQSNIRKWLNETFYQTAFAVLQQSMIEVVEVDNSAKSTNPYGNLSQWDTGVNNYACANTYDKIFLLSEEEVTIPNYGFSAAFDKADTAKYKKASDYAKCQGVSIIKGQELAYAQNGAWLLRSPDSADYHNIRRVSADGFAVDTSYASCIREGIVPALKLNVRAEA